MSSALTYIREQFRRVLDESKRTDILLTLNALRRLSRVEDAVTPILENLLSQTLLHQSPTPTWVIRMARLGTMYQTEDRKEEELDMERLEEIEMISNMLNVIWTEMPALTSQDWTNRRDTTLELLAELYFIAPNLQEDDETKNEERFIDVAVKEDLNLCIASLPGSFHQRIVTLSSSEQIPLLIESQLICLCKLYVLAFVAGTRFTREEIAHLRKPLEDALDVCVASNLSDLCANILIVLVMMKAPSLNATLYFSRLLPMWTALAGNATLTIPSALAWAFMDVMFGTASAESLSQIQRTGEEGTSVVLHVPTTVSRPRRGSRINYAEASGDVEYEEQLDVLTWDKIGQVYLGKSQISTTHDTGMGVFALVDFNKGDVITQYCGEYLRKLPRGLAKDPHTPYLFEYKHDPKTHPSDWRDQFRTVYINGETNPSKCTSRQIAQFLQDPRDKMYVNSEIKFLPTTWIPPQYRDDEACLHGKGLPKKKENRLHFYAVATRRIPKGKEIYLDYNYSVEFYDRFGMIAKTVATLDLPPPAPFTKLLKS